MWACAEHRRASTCHEPRKHKHQNRRQLRVWLLAYVPPLVSPESRSSATWWYTVHGIDRGVKMYGTWRCCFFSPGGAHSGGVSHSGPLRSTLLQQLHDSTCQTASAAAGQQHGSYVHNSFNRGLHNEETTDQVAPFVFLSSTGMWSWHSSIAFLIVCWNTHLLKSELYSAIFAFSIQWIPEYTRVLRDEEVFPGAKLTRRIWCFEWCFWRKTPTACRLFLILSWFIWLPAGYVTTASGVAASCFLWFLLHNCGLWALRCQYGWEFSDFLCDWDFRKSWGI